MELSNLFSQKFTNDVKNLLSKMSGEEVKNFKEYIFYVVKVTSSYYNIIYASEKLCQLTEYENYDILCNNPGIFNGPLTDKKMTEINNEKIKEGISYSSFTINYKKNGETFRCRTNIDYIKNITGNSKFIVVLLDYIYTPKKLDFLINEYNIVSDD